MRWWRGDMRHSKPVFTGYIKKLLSKRDGLA